MGGRAAVDKRVWPNTPPSPEVPVSDAIWIACIAALPGLLMSLGTILQVRRVHVLVNSQKDALTRLLRESLVKIATMEGEAVSKDEVVKILRAQLVQPRPPSIR